MSYVSSRTLILTSILALGLLAYSSNILDRFASITRVYVASMPSSTAGQGWHERALRNPYPSAHDFQPSLSNLQFALLRNAPVEVDGFTAAVFKPETNDAKPVVVDAMGRVLYLEPSDYDALLGAAQRVMTSSLPDTGNFRNTWVVHRPITSQFIERLLVFQGSSTYQETSVQGFQKNDPENKLRSPVEGFQVLPQAISNFFALGLEAQNGHELGQEDNVVVDKVRAIFPQGVY